MRVALDSNILIRLAIATDAQHPAVRAALRTLRAHGHTFCTFLQNVAEFWNVCTRPASARGGYGLTVEAATDRLRLVERLFPVLPDTPDIYRIWRQLVTAHAVKGVQVHDARLAAAMMAHGVTHLLTLNAADFHRFPGIIPLTPEEAATLPPAAPVT